MLYRFPQSKIGFLLCHSISWEIYSSDCNHQLPPGPYGWGQCDIFRKRLHVGRKMENTDAFRDWIYPQVFHAYTAQAFCADTPLRSAVQPAKRHKTYLMQKFAGMQKISFCYAGYVSSGEVETFCCKLFLVRDKDWKSIETGCTDAYFVQLDQMQMM